jgi:hypothetical protein
MHYSILYLLNKLNFRLIRYTNSHYLTIEMGHGREQTQPIIKKYINKTSI